MHVIIITVINKAISFAGIVDPLEGTASAEAMLNFRQELSLSLGRDGMASAAKNCKKGDAAMVLITTHTIRVRQFRLCVIVSCPLANQMHRMTKSEMSPEVRFVRWV